LLLKERDVQVGLKVVLQKKGCKHVSIKHWWAGKKIIIRRYRQCGVKKFSKKYERTQCCRFTRICVGKKCKNLKRGCFWTGKKVLTGFNTILRWKVMCRDIPFGRNKDIRLNCCKVQQRCTQDGPVYKCHNIKRSKCWWRGAIRGDVWIQNQNGDWTEVNAQGTFNYLTDKETGIVINTQFSRLGSGSVTSAISISARGKTIVANRRGKITINGKRVHRKPGHSLLIKFIHNRVTIKSVKGHPRLTKIRGLSEEKLGYIYDRKTKSYQLTLYAYNSSTGLFTDPEHPVRYQIAKKSSKFKRYVPFKLIVSKHGTVEERRKGMKCCHLLPTESKLNKCINDYVRTKRCFVDQYTNQNPTKKNILNKK